MSNAAYLRVSSDKQTALRQRETLKHLPIDRWYEDSEGSNPRDRADRRPEFQRLLRDVERGFVKTIYVASQDRFGTKDAYKLGHFFTLLRKHDCRLLDASGKVLSADDDATVITSTIGALTSTRKQKEKANRILTGKITKVRGGATYQGGNPPYGFDVACIGPNGNEKWRVVYEGHNRRRKTDYEQSSGVVKGQ
jgi:DNA invertase Pin-like site-specific DNA recombinase